MVVLLSIMDVENGVPLLESHSRYVFFPFEAVSVRQYVLMLLCVLVSPLLLVYELVSRLPHRWVGLSSNNVFRRKCGTQQMAANIPADISVAGEDEKAMFFPTTSCLCRMRQI